MTARGLRGLRESQRICPTPWKRSSLLVTLFCMKAAHTAIDHVSRARLQDSNRVQEKDLAAHDWYRFVLAYPPHLVAHYLSEFGVTERDTVLDPFCGTGTTLVECRKRGIPSVGIEATPMGFFASSVKTAWHVDPERLLRHAEAVAARTVDRLEAQGISDAAFFSGNGADQGKLKALPPETEKLLLKDSISPLPLHKTLTLLEEIKGNRSSECVRHEQVALAKALVASISNLHFGPEVGVGAKKADAAVVAPWLANIHAIADDLRELRKLKAPRTDVYHADSREVLRILPKNSINAVITSPPYPNEKDYTRTTRLESVIFGFLKDKDDLQALKRTLVRSNTRNVYKGDEDDKWVADNQRIQRIAEQIEARRIELGKTSGFERLYHKVTKLYFGGIFRHLAELRDILKPGALLAYVVGDQASYLRVMIRTGRILGDLACSLGYEVLKTDLFRTRMATATKDKLREEVVVMRWPGKGNGGQ